MLPHHHLSVFYTVGQVDAAFLRVYPVEDIVGVVVEQECVFCPFVDERIMVMLSGCVAHSFIFIGTLVGFRPGFFHPVIISHAVFNGFYLIEILAWPMRAGDLFFVEARLHLKVEDKPAFFSVEIVFSL